MIVPVPLRPSEGGEVKADMSLFTIEEVLEVTSARLLLGDARDCGARFVACVRTRERLGREICLLRSRATILMDTHSSNSRSKKEPLVRSLKADQLLPHR